MKQKKYLFVTLKVVDDGREYTQRCLLQTLCKDLEYAAQYLAAHFWDDSWLENGIWYSHGGGVATKVEDYKQLTYQEYEIVDRIFYG